MFKFKLTSKQFKELKAHLHPGDGLEALAFGLCGRHSVDGSNILLLNKLLLFPHKKCQRSEHYVSWEPSEVENLLEEAKVNNFGIVKFHSHPENYTDFSELDNKSDKEFFESVYSWIDNDAPHASIIIYPNGEFKGRIIEENLRFNSINSISVIGEEILIYNDTSSKFGKDFLSSMDRNSQAFGSKTTQLLRGLKIGVVGCSGTGSPTIEQLARLGVGELTLVDSDNVELANINRIIGTSVNDAKGQKLKVDVIKENIDKIGLETTVNTYPFLIQESKETIDELASCDIIFGCVDSAMGRYYLNLISHYYLIPLIDIGVKLSSDGKGGIDSINGNIHYVTPGSRSLMERKVFNSIQIEEEELKRKSPEEYENRKNYFDNEKVTSPAVISVNMLHSSLAVNEMLSRLHPFRFSDNKFFGTTRVNLTDWDISNEKVSESKSKILGKETLGIGNKQPLIHIE